MWAQKVDYSHNRQHSANVSHQQNRRNSASHQRKSTSNSQNHGIHQSRPVQSRDRGHSIELPQKSSHLDENFLNSSQGPGGSTRHSMQRHAKIHNHGQQEHESDSLMNQTQIIQGNSSNDRGNRMNIRQNSRHNHKTTHSTQQADSLQPQIYQRDSVQMSKGKSTHGKSSGTGGIKGDASFCNYDVNPTRESESEIQDKFYQTQKVGTSMFAQLKGNSGSSSNQKNQSSAQQQQRQQHETKGDESEMSRNMMQVKQSGSSTQHQPVGSHSRRRSTENVSAASYGTTKKKVQPPQPRNREEISSRRSAAANTSQTQQPQREQHHKQQNEQQSNKNSSHKIQSQTTGSDKFSQLVCQVPQGSNQPQMATSQPTPTSAAGQAFAQAQAAAQESHDQAQNFLLGPQRKSEQGRKTLVLDLDETLVHSSFKPVENPDITLPVEIDGQVCIIYVLVRPLVAQFLKRMHKLYELVIFTASLSKYAEPLMKQLDPNQMCSYRLFREHCTFFNNAFVKDLTRLGRPMTDVIIVDNSPVAYLFQPENAIPAVNWYDDPSDTELARIATLLERMVYEDDVRKVIRSIVANNKIDFRQEQLYLASTSNANQRRDKSQRADRRTRPSNFTGGHIITQQQLADAVQQEQVRDVRKDEKKKEVYIPEEEQQSHRSQRKQSQNNNYPAGGSSRNQAAASHSRYESSDTRQKHAAIIIEQINQRKRGNDMQDVECILQNVQSSSPSAAATVNTSKTLIQKLQSSSNEIKQAYDHHKQQILQLKNEIAVLKGQSATSSPTNAQSSAAHNAPRSSNSKNKIDQNSQQYLQEQPLRSQNNESQRVEGQQSGSNGKTRESSKKQRSGGKDSGVYNQKYPEMPEQASSNSYVYKDNPSKRGENSRQIRDSNEKIVTANTRTGHSSKQSAQNIQKHEIQLLNYTKQGTTSGQTNDKKRDNHPITNTKQVIKLIKKNENHSNHDITNTQQYQLINQEHAINIQPQSQTSQGFRHPSTTKNQAKGSNLFAFNSIAQNIQQQLSKVEENNRGGNQPYSQSQINMISSHSNQPSRISSKTVKNTSSNPKTSQTLRTSQLKHREQGNSSQTNKIISTSQSNYDRSTNLGTKRSSSVKNSSSHANRQSHEVQEMDHRHRKGSHQATSGYNSLAGSYSQNHHQKRERGNSAQPLQTSSHYSNSNQLIVQNVGHRSSSTTNKNKKSMSTTGVSQGLQLFNGSQSTKHSHHHGTTLSHHHSGNGQLLSSSSHNVNHKGNSSERHQSAKVQNNGRQSSKTKNSSSKQAQSSHHDANRESDHHHNHREQLQHPVLYQHQREKDHYNQFNGNQKVNSGQGLSLNQYQTNIDQTRQATNVVKQSLKDFQMQDMLRLTQNTVASTRHSKKPGSVSLLSGAIGSPSNNALNATSDDFLNKIKMQQDHVNKSRTNNNGSSNNAHQSTQKSYTMLQQQQAQSQSGVQGQTGLTINSPKYAGGNRDPTILSDILNLTQVSATNANAQRNRNAGEKQSSQGQHQIKKLRVSGSTSGTNGRNTAASNQSVGTHSQGHSGAHRGHSASRGSTGNSSSHHHNPHSSNSHHQQRGNSGSNRESSRKAQQFNQTMKFSSTASGVNALLNELSAPTPTNNEYDKQTAANLFLQSHNNNQMYQTSYFGGSNATHSDGQLGQNQLREVTRHFYNQLALEKKTNQ